MIYTIDEAKMHFSQLLDLVENGEEVITVLDCEPVARLVAARPFSDEEAEEFLQGRG